jgi:hypothetical protein
VATTDFFLVKGNRYNKLTLEPLPDDDDDESDSDSDDERADGERAIYYAGRFCQERSEACVGISAFVMLDFLADISGV